MSASLLSRSSFRATSISAPFNKTTQTIRACALHYNTQHTSKRTLNHRSSSSLFPSASSFSSPLSFSAPSSLSLPSLFFRSFSSSASPSLVLLADHSNSKLTDTFLHLLTASRALHPSAPLSILILGDQTAVDAVASQAASLASSSSSVNVVKISHPSLAHLPAESVTEALKQYSSAHPFTHLIASTSTFAKDVIPRLGAVLDVQPITDVIGIHDNKTFTRPVYAGNALAKVQSNDPIQLLTVRTTSFEKASASSSSSSSVPVSSFSFSPPASSDSYRPSKWLKDELSASTRPELASARVVISGGRGLKSGENFALLEKLADQLPGAAVGASRAAVDAGFVPNEYQVGQTGKVVAPELYVAVGISGAIQHLAGMKDSKTIVAINKDAEAPIFQVADYGIVGDLFKVVPELTEKLSKK